LLLVKRGGIGNAKRQNPKPIPQGGTGSTVETRTDFEHVKHKWMKVGPWVLANSLAGQTLGVSFMQRALENTPTGLVLSIIATTPIVVMPLAHVFEGERATRRSLAGGVLAVLGVILLVTNRR